MLATGQPSGLAITHCLPLPLPAAPSPPCQAALMPLASSCQQMFVCGVAGRQLNRDCIFLAPGPLEEPSFPGLCRPMCQRHVSRSTGLAPGERLTQARMAEDNWKVQRGLSHAPSSPGNCSVRPFHKHIWGDWNSFCQMLIKTRTTTPPPSEVTCGSLPMGIWTAGWTTRHSVNTVYLRRHLEI